MTMHAIPGPYRWLLAVLLLGGILAGSSSAEQFFEYELRLVGLIAMQSVADSPLNPYNSRFFLPKSRAEGHVRPNLFYRTGKFDLSAKPRWINRRNIDEPRVATFFRDNQETDIFVNEWYFRYRFTNNLFGSVGREILLWGPSRMLSPSNPFRERNGRTEPQFELPGLDFARLVWVASPQYTVSVMANIGKGRLASFGQWRETNALKVDWTGDRKQAGLILSRREGGDPALGQTDPAENALGLYAMMHTSRAQIAYLEGSYDEEDVSVLGGTSYNFGGGKVAVLEYFHDGRGLRFKASGFGRPNQGKGDGYGLLQYSDNLQGTSLTWRLRLDHAFEDGSNRFYGFMNWADSDWLEFFVNGHVNFGGDEYGFGAFYDRQVLVGGRYTF